MKRPEEYKKRILLVSLGTSPQIITEVIYALTEGRRRTGEPMFIPTRVVVISTQEGIRKSREALELMGHYQRLISEYQLSGLPKPEYFAISKDGVELNDIRTTEDNEAAADSIKRIALECTRDDDAALHISIAGGRKTQGYYTGLVASLFCREQDTLSHVLVSEGYEGHPEFYFPTSSDSFIQVKDQMLNAKEAIVELAQLPLISVRKDLPNGFFDTGSDLSVSEVVRRISVDRTSIDLQLRVAPNSISLITCGIQFDISHDLLLAAYVLMFYRWQHDLEYRYEVLGKDDKPIISDRILLPKGGDPKKVLNRYLQSLAEIISITQPNMSVNNLDLSNPKAVFLFLEEAGLNGKTISLLTPFDKKVGEFKFGFVMDTFYSDRRTSMRELLELELPEFWVDALLPHPIRGKGHKVELNEDKFTYVSS
uniref:CRISPR-associated ring nuclease Csm6 n=1 Tax=Roseivirga sp. TaxID=1964215 RepID=UPI00404889D2